MQFLAQVLNKEPKADGFAIAPKSDGAAGEGGEAFLAEFVLPEASAEPEVPLGEMGKAEIDVPAAGPSLLVAEESEAANRGLFPGDVVLPEAASAPDGAVKLQIGISAQAEDLQRAGTTVRPVADEVPGLAAPSASTGPMAGETTPMGSDRPMSPIAVQAVASTAPPASGQLPQVPEPKGERVLISDGDLVAPRVGRASNAPEESADLRPGALGRGAQTSVAPTGAETRPGAIASDGPTSPVLADTVPEKTVVGNRSDDGDAAFAPKAHQKEQAPKIGATSAITPPLDNGARPTGTIARPSDPVVMQPGQVSNTAPERADESLPQTVARVTPLPLPSQTTAQPQLDRSVLVKQSRAHRGEPAAEITVTVAAAGDVPDVPQQPVLGAAVHKDLGTHLGASGREAAFAREESLLPLSSVEGAEVKKLGAEVAAPKTDPTVRPVLAQLVQAARSTVDGMVEVKLSPEELGRVRLAMTGGEAGTGMNVVVTAERPETLDLIRRNIDLFAADLAEQGFTDLNFSFGGETSDDDQQKHGGASGHRVTLEPTSVFEGRIAPQTGAVDGRVDLRL